MSAAEFSAFNRARREWFVEHGVNPGDWSVVYPILLASYEAHGLQELSAVGRARLRATALEHDRNRATGIRQTRSHLPQSAGAEGLHGSHPGP